MLTSLATLAVVNPVTATGAPVESAKWTVKLTDEPLTALVGAVTVTVGSVALGAMYV